MSLQFLSTVDESHIAGWEIWFFFFSSISMFSRDVSLLSPLFSHFFYFTFHFTLHPKSTTAYLNWPAKRCQTPPPYSWFPSLVHNHSFLGSQRYDRQMFCNVSRPKLCKCRGNPGSCSSTCLPCIHCNEEKMQLLAEISNSTMKPNIFLLNRLFHEPNSLTQFLNGHYPNRIHLAYILFLTHISGRRCVLRS